MAVCKLKEIYQVDSVYGAFYSGGDIEWTNDGTQFLCLCEGKIKVFDVNNGKVSDFCNQDVDKDDDELDAVLTFCLSSDNTTVVSAHKSGLFKSWKWKEENTNPKVWKSIHKGPVARVTLNHCGTILVSGGSDSSVRIWDLTHNACLRNLTGLQGVVRLKNNDRMYMNKLKPVCHRWHTTPIHCPSLQWASCVTAWEMDDSDIENALDDFDISELSDFEYSGSEYVPSSICSDDSRAESVGDMSDVEDNPLPVSNQQLVNIDIVANPQPPTRL
ncbi:Transducin (beta)-like 3 [Homalodisca vitripennis]|nr:Transducin (beta)-like 3 [Homalodisca vitripennis]